MSTPRWTEDDSRDLDREVLALRAADKRERSARPQSPSHKPRRPRSPQPYRRNRWPTPRQRSNGRWLAEVTEQGQFHCCTFDTEVEAQAWLDSITGRQDD